MVCSVRTAQEHGPVERRAEDDSERAHVEEGHGQRVEQPDEVPPVGGALTYGCVVFW